MFRGCALVPEEEIGDEGPPSDDAPPDTPEIELLRDVERNLAAVVDGSDVDPKVQARSRCGNGRASGRPRHQRKARPVPLGKPHTAQNVILGTATPIQAAYAATISRRKVSSRGHRVSRQRRGGGSPAFPPYCA